MSRQLVDMREVLYNGSVAYAPKELRICTETDCSEKWVAKGLCDRHYRRIYRSASFKPTKVYHGKTNYPEYRNWAHMLSRCRNETDEGYPSYGGRGIKVCDRWLSFENFYLDMGEKPTPKHSIDRIDNDGNYEPSNCRWATQQVQNINRGLRSNNTSGVKGVNKSRNRWIASITVDGRLMYLGSFKTVEEAALVRKKAELQYYEPLLRSS